MARGKQPNEDREKAVKKAAELNELGKPWKKIMEILETEGFRDAKRNPYKEANMRSSVSIMRSKLRNAVPTDAIPSIPQEPPKPPGDTSVGHKPTGSIPTSKASDIPARTGVIPDKEAVIPPRTSDIPFTSNQVTRLLSMLKWWKDQGGEAAGLPTPLGERPHFDRSVAERASIRISKTLYKDSAQWAKKHRLETGGTFSGLVELLLWRHLGSDPKYLRPAQDD